MLTRALTGATSPPPSCAEIAMVMTELALPWSDRDREITPAISTAEVNGLYLKRNSQTLFNNLDIIGLYDRGLYHPGALSSFS
jgi:hypothetical protein